MASQILAVGDLHLGRTPGRLPEELRDRDRELGPAGAWERVVELALRESVDAVVLAGDVVEQANDFFEAYRELSAGVERLIAAGIRVGAVAGNHDVLVLPRLADRISGFELLGREGVWEQARLESGNEIVTLHGYSFADHACRTSPLAGARLERGPGVNLGVLHADVDQPESVYAPVRTRELEAAGLDGWLLGHIHRPDSLSVEHPAGYLGSVSGLDPGEPGPHGPWLLEIERGRMTKVEQCRLAPLQWEPVAVDLSDIAAPEDAREALLARVHELDAEPADRTMPPIAVGLRVTFTGRTNLRRRVKQLLDAEELGAISAGSGRIHYFVEDLRYETRPQLDLQTLADRRDPPGLLARRLLVLDRPPSDPERQALIEAARAHLRNRITKHYFEPIDGVSARLHRGAAGGVASGREGTVGAAGGVASGCEGTVGAAGASPDAGRRGAGRPPGSDGSAPAGEAEEARQGGGPSEGAGAPETDATEAIARHLREAASAALDRLLAQRTAEE